jgi:hypothetical protein
MDNKKLSDEEAAKLLKQKEEASHLEYDKPSDISAEDVSAAANKMALENDEPVQSLGKSQAWQDQNSRSNEPDTMINIGWKPFPSDSLPSRGMFYPDGTTFAIRAASVAEIRHFSTIDENDPLDLDDKLNMIVDKCLQIKFPDRHASWKDLKEEDRFCLIFAIRAITFINGENKLFVNLKCGQTCLGDGSYNEKIELNNDNFEYYNIEPKLMRFYSQGERCFIVPSDMGPIKLFIPSLGVTTFIKNYLRDKARKGEFYDKTFIKVAPFMFGDWRTLSDAIYKNAERDSFGWNSKKLSAMLKLVELIRFGVKTKLTRSCDKCGAEVSSPLSFPGGIKSLFLHGDSFGDALDDILGKNS